MDYFEQYYALRQRSIERIKQVVALKQELKELNTEYQLLHQELQAVKQENLDFSKDIQYWSDAYEDEYRKNKALKEELEVTKLKVKQWKLLVGVLEDMYDPVRRWCINK